MKALALALVGALALSACSVHEPLAKEDNNCICGLVETGPGVFKVDILTPEGMTTHEGISAETLALLQSPEAGGLESCPASPTS